MAGRRTGTGSLTGLCSVPKVAQSKLMSRAFPVTTVMSALGKAEMDCEEICMQGIWYGDRRDRVKWGALFYLSESRNIPNIVQVAYSRTGLKPMLQAEAGKIALSSIVWNHFSDLQRIKQLEKLSKKKIVVLDETFDPADRRRYIQTIVRQLDGVPTPKIAFLDPDTGIEPKNLKPGHVARRDLEQIWDSLEAGDILAVYQHAGRNENWLENSCATLGNICAPNPVGTILGTGVAADVGILWSHNKC
jgi:hypothetical protein